jgi:nitroreductase
MDAIDAIERRTSVRRFRSDPVSRATIERLLEAAVRAPNHKLTEPWRFAVLTGSVKARLADIQAAHRRERFDDPAGPDADAAAEKKRREVLDTPAILVAMCAVSADERTREEDYAAAMMALENFMIAAQSLGLGTYLRTGGIIRDPGLLELLGLAPDFRVVGVLSLGYPAGEETPRRRRPAAELTTWLGE